MAQVTVGSILPVGTIIHSMLTTAQFQTQYGTNWVLADGSSCTGTKYASVTGATTLPDMRGKFLRGKNNGASGASYNPDGDLALGTYTADRVKEDAGSTSVNTNALPIDTLGNGSFVVQETSPKSITVNIFIRVN